MNLSSEKIRKLEQVSRLYYEQNKKQEEIAAIMGLSRPFISRMLNEARQMGIVEIKIRPFDQTSNLLLAKAKEHFALKGGVLVPDTTDDQMFNRSLAQAVIQYIRQLGGGRLGIDWGTIVGNLVRHCEQSTPEKDVITDICPIVGNSGVHIRNYHSNENVRIIAHQTMANPCYLYAPAFAETHMEVELLQQTEHYKTVLREWKRLDIALINIENHPSSPDFASTARYGNLLSLHRAVGRLIAYYYNESGEVIRSDSDYAIQIPLPLLRSCPHVIGVCSANVKRKSLAGALRTGLISHVIASETLMSEVLKFC